MFNIEMIVVIILFFLFFLSLIICSYKLILKKEDNYLYGNIFFLKYKYIGIILLIFSFFLMKPITLDLINQDIVSDVVVIKDTQSISKELNLYEKIKTNNNNYHSFFHQYDFTKGRTYSITYLSNSKIIINARLHE